MFVNIFMCMRASLFMYIFRSSWTHKVLRIFFVRILIYICMYTHVYRMQFFEFIFLARDWSTDRIGLYKQLNSFVADGIYIYI